MKTHILSAALLTCSFTLGHAQSVKSITYDQTIPILNDVVPTEDHQAKDVFVSRVDNIYRITFFVKAGGVVKEHNCRVTYDKTLTSASYTWLSAHRLALRLEDADSANFFDIEVAGKKNWTSMECNLDGER